MLPTAYYSKVILYLPFCRVMDIGELRYTIESAKGVGCCFSTPPIYLMSRWLNAGEAGLCRRWPLLWLHQRKLYSCKIPHTHTQWFHLGVLTLDGFVIILQTQITSDKSVVLGWRHFLSEFTHAMMLDLIYPATRQNLYRTDSHFILCVLCKPSKRDFFINIRILGD